jgi:glycosyltransferase involved in cell wall biosynthesis
MAMGKAIVTTDIVEIITHGETGLCVARRDPQAMAGAIISLLENESLAESLGQAAKRASRDFGVNDYVRRLEGIYEEMVAEKQN